MSFKILNKINYNSEFILIGAGKLGELSMQLWPKLLQKPILYLDKYKKGSINGIPIIDFENHKFNNRYIYVLSNFTITGKEVKKLFEDINQEIFTIYDLLNFWIPEKFSNGWQKDERLIDDKIVEIFSDNKSKLIYENVLNWRYSRILDDNYINDGNERKFNLNLLEKKEYDCVVDGGSYAFEFYYACKKNNINFHNYIAFEPDEINIKKMPEDLILNKGIQVYNYCLYDKSKIVNFIENGNFASRIIESVSGTVPKKGIDITNFLIDRKIINTSKINKILIKLHVEGAEYKAFKGALKLLKNNIVDFIINLTHDEESLIKIPMKLYNLKHYDLRLESTSCFGEGLFLIAIDKRNNI